MWTGRIPCTAATIGGSLEAWARQPRPAQPGDPLRRSADQRGWDEIAPAFEFLASRFSNCKSFEYEVIAAGASGDLGYIVGIEHTIAAVGSAAPEPCMRCAVTTIFRRENGAWKAVHRQAIPCKTVPRHVTSYPGSASRTRSITVQAHVLPKLRQEAAMPASARGSTRSAVLRGLRLDADQDGGRPYRVVRTFTSS